MAIGGLTWGAIASHTSVAFALSLSALLTFVGVWITRKQILKFGNDADATPWQFDDQPSLTAEITHEDGPVAVQVVYRVNPALKSEFILTIHAVGTARKRNGARAWRLYRDLSDATYYAERFVVDSWADYLRQYARWTVADQKLEERLRDFQLDEEPMGMQLFVRERSPPRCN